MLPIPDRAADGPRPAVFTAAGRYLADLYSFARVAVFGFTAMLPLIGALAVTVRLDAATLAALLVVAVSFHVYAYVLNDVMDLEIDRRRPQRANDPLVAGRIARASALGIAVAQVPLAFLAARWLGASSAAVLALGAAFTALGAYDVWGKRCLLPPLTDFVQAFGWACLVLFGAVTAGGVTAEALWLCIAVIAYVMLTNGVHGALRDLRGDLEGGARTTAIYFGARLLPPASVDVPRSLLVYGVALHVVMFVAVGVALGLPSRTDDPRWWLSSSLLAFAAALCAGLLRAAYRSASDARRAETAGTSHLFVCMSALAIPAVADARGGSIAAVGIVFTLPLLARAAYRKAKSA